MEPRSLSDAPHSPRSLNVPEGWEMVRLRDVATFSSGTTPSRARNADYFASGNHYWVKTLDLNNSRIVYTDERVTDRALTETSLRAYPPGTVLVAMYGGFQQIGRTGLLAVPAAVNQAITAVHVNRRKLLPEYLLHVLNFRVGYWRLVASSSRKDPNITSVDVKNFPILYPEVPEQREICEALQAAQDAIVSVEQSIDKREAIVQAIRQNLLTKRIRLPGFTDNWTHRRLAEMLSYEQPGRYLVRTSRQLESGRVPVLTAGKTFILGYTNEREGIYKEHPVIIFDDFTTASKYVAFDFKAKSSAMKILSARPGINVRFAYELMQVIEFPVGDHKRHWITEYSQQVVDVPSEAEQSAIASVLDDYNEQIVALQARLAKLRAIREGMMQELLTGRTRLAVARGAE